MMALRLAGLPVWEAESAAMAEAEAFRLVGEILGRRGIRTIRGILGIREIRPTLGIRVDLRLQ
jgi:hypothetical protein